MGNLEVDFLTSNERKANTLENRGANTWDLVGKISGLDSEEIMWYRTEEFFSTFPAKGTNSTDRMYSLPYDDDFLTALAKEKQAKQEDRAQRGHMAKPKAEPWTYQEGLIFWARLFRQSPKAFLLKIKGFGTTWVPKAQVDFEEGSPWGEVWIPEWLLRDKGLGLDDAPIELNPPFEWETALKGDKPRKEISYE